VTDRIDRRNLLIRGTLATAGFTLSPILERLWALEEGEEVVEFTDYTDAFRIDAQADNPMVKCLDLRQLTSGYTPNDQFFVFHHTETMYADPDRWRLRIGGLVERPAEFSLQDLKERPNRVTVGATIECSGNSNHPQIMNGLVSNATWTGINLSSLLQECGILPEAREVVFFALDKTREMKWQAGDVYYTVPYGRSIFVQDALQSEALLAFEMNGEPLPAQHGAPLRLILPGWYGMANVKWLTRIEVIDRRYEGQHMARNYHSLHALPTPEDTIWLDTSISRNNLKSVVARVTRFDKGSETVYRIRGAAWGGTAPIERVEIQIDAGEWRPTTIQYRGSEFEWLLWSCDWEDATPGPHTLVSRAVDSQGNIQPTRAELKKKLASSREDNSQWPRSILI